MLTYDTLASNLNEYVDWEGHDRNNLHHRHLPIHVAGPTIGIRLHGSGRSRSQPYERFRPTVRAGQRMADRRRASDGKSLCNHRRVGRRAAAGPLDGSGEASTDGRLP